MRIVSVELRKTAPTCNDASTLCGGPQHDLGAAGDAVGAVGKGEAARERHLYEVTLGVQDRLLHCVYNLLCRGAPNADLCGSTVSKDKSTVKSPSTPNQSK